MRKVKLLHIQLFPMLSGVQRVTLEEFRRLDRETFECHLVTSSAGPLSEAAADLGVHCHAIPSLKRPIAPQHDWLAYRALRKFMTDFKFDIVHTHSSKTGVLGRMAARAAKVPAVVHTVHGFAFPAAKNGLIRRIYKQCEIWCRSRTDALICLNPDDCQLSIADLGFDPKRVHRIPNGVDVDRFSPLEDADEIVSRRKTLLPGNPDLPAVMMVGRLWDQKNPQAFVAAAAEVLASGCNAEFYLVGDGDLRDELQSELHLLGISERVHLLGWRDDVHDLLPLADLMVLPSRWEGMPLVLLEAQACGVPVIASDIAGNRDCVLHGEDGYLVSLTQTSGFSSRIRELLIDGERRRALANAAREKIVSEFTIETRTARIVELYEHLLGIALGSTDTALPPVWSFAGE